MGKSTPSTPSAPDPGYVGAQQTQSNVNTAVANSYLNRINQYGPQGSKTYTQGGSQNVGGVDIPLWNEHTTLSPEQQNLYDTQTRVTQGAYDLADQYTGRIGEATRDAFNYEGLPGAPEYNEQYRQQQRDQIIARNQPQMDRDAEALRTRLANQGISLGSEAWNNAQDDYGRSVNDFRLGADIQSGTAAAQQYGLEASTRDRAIQERANLRTQPINEVAALLGTGQGVQAPQFAPVPQVQVAPTDVSGNYWNAYQGQVAQQQAAQRSSNAAMGGLFGLGGSIIGGLAGGPLGASLGGLFGSGLGGIGDASGSRFRASPGLGVTSSYG